MDPENILNLLVDLLPLDSETGKFVREVFFEILRSCKSLFSSTDFKVTPTFGDIEDTAAKLREVIAYFNLADEEQDRFIDIFPEWEANRKENIQKLREIAESMRDSRQICSVAKIVGGGVGILGGAAIIGSILFPPAAPAVLPTWLGGAAATALIPSFLIPSFLLPAATTAVTSSLAVGGTIAASAGGIAQAVTSVAEATLLSSQIEKAKEICREDKNIFNRMMSWFEHTQQLKSALDNLFDINILKIIFADLKDYFGQCNIGSKAFRLALKSCVRKTLGHGLFNPSFHIAVTAVTFAVFLIRRRNRFLFQWIIVGFGLLATFNAAPQIGRLVASSVMKEGHLIPQALASKVSVGAVTGIGIALDVASVVLNSIDLVEGSKSEVQKNVLEVAKELQTNLDFIREVYQKLLNAAKKVSEDFLNSLIVDHLSMSGTIIKIAHEVYQDVLQETRKLRRSVKLSGRKWDGKQEEESLRKVIDFFNAEDKERVNFCNYFCQWDNKRKKNIASLLLIAESLQEFRTLGGAAQHVGGTKSAAGIGEWLLQRSQRAIDTVIVTSRTVINNSNATNLVAQLRQRTEATNRICKQDIEDFTKMEGWFRRIHELNSAFDELFGEETFDTIFMDLKMFCGGGLQKYRESGSYRQALKSCVRKIFGHHLRLGPSYQQAAIAVVFAVLLDARNSLFRLNCFNVTHRSSFGRSRFNEGRWTSEFTNEENSVLQTLEIGSVEGRIVFLDTINAVLKLVDRDEAEIRALAGKLQEELDSMREVRIQCQSDS